MRPSSPTSAERKPACRTFASSPTPGPAGVPRGQDRVARDPVPLDGQVVVALRVGRLEQVCPQRVVPGERRLERVEHELGVVVEQGRRTRPRRSAIRAFMYASSRS